MNDDQLITESIRTRLYTWEDDLAERVGRGRTEQNAQKRDRASYDANKLMESNLLANQHAAVAEIGVARVMGAYCFAGIWSVHMHKTYSNLPDVLWGTIEVEVKWRRSGRFMPVDAKDAEKNRLVIWAECRLASKYGCVCDFCSRWTEWTDVSMVRVLGGGWAGELWSKGTSYGEDTQRVKVDPMFLTPIKELLSKPVAN